jgi:hypothetical protein
VIKFGPVSWAGFGPRGRFGHENRPTGFPVFFGTRRPHGPIGPVLYRERDGRRPELFRVASQRRLSLARGKPAGSGRGYWQPSARVRMARRTCSGSLGQASTSRTKSTGSSWWSVQPVCNRKAPSAGTVCVPLPCNATLSDSGSACLGSNPSSPAFLKPNMPV